MRSIPVHSNRPPPTAADAALLQANVLWADEHTRAGQRNEGSMILHYFHLSLYQRKLAQDSSVGPLIGEAFKAMETFLQTWFPA